MGVLIANATVPSVTPRKSNENSELPLRQYSLGVAIKRSTRSAACTRGPKSPAACCEMTVLCRSSTMPEVPAVPLCPLEGAISVNTTVPPRQRTTKGPGRGVMLHKLLYVGQAHWQRLIGLGFVVLARAGADLIDWKLQKRDDHERRSEGAPPETTLGHDQRSSCPLLWGRASAETAGCQELPNSTMVRSWQIRTLSQKPR